MAAMRVNCRSNTVIYEEEEISSWHDAEAGRQKYVTSRAKKGGKWKQM